MKLNKVTKAGFTLVEIMIVVAIIGLLAAIAIPNFVKARTAAQANACINNLRQIDGAKQQWALENKQAPTATPAATDIQPYLGRGTNGTVFSCPLTNVTAATGGDISYSYVIGDLQTPPTCRLGDALTPTPHKLQ
jgi:prepilin-type N-terminal cleavage/methylation domain-containing protein